MIQTNVHKKKKKVLFTSIHSFTKNVKDDRVLAGRSLGDGLL
jgi:hypothetical protein